MNDRYQKMRALCMSAVLCVTLSGTVWASGGDGFSENVYAPEFHVTEQDLPAYAGGDLGIVPGSYWRIYQFLAYRALTGDPLSKSELADLNIHGWHVGPDAGAWDAASNQEENGVSKWLAARKSILGPSTLKIDVIKTSSNNDYYAFINCPYDAMARATKTLGERLKSGGKQWTTVWLANQDAVFANCSAAASTAREKKQEATTLPAALPPKAPDWLAHDHEYQTAAALFYAEKFDLARERFQAIAKNAKSPWQPLGGYLAARCLIRKATLQTLPPGADAEQGKKLRDELLEKARAELLEQSKVFPPAKDLIGWVDARVRPQQRLLELAKVLAAGRFDEATPARLSDYLVILDTVDKLSMINSIHPMTAWIGTMQAGVIDDQSSQDPETMQKNRNLGMAAARKHWQAKRDSLWLLPLLANAKPGELVEEELKAAAAVPAAAPGFHTLQYHLARLAIAQGKADSVDPVISDILKKSPDPMSAATRNRWLSLKMLSARTMDEFFHAALRENTEKKQGVPIPNEGAAPPSKDGTDADFERHMFQHLSLAQLKLAHLRTQEAPKLYLPIAIWTRAVILGDYATADEFTGELIKGRDTTKHLYERFKNAKGNQAKRQAAMIILVNAPELNPQTLDPAGGSMSWGCANDWGRPVLPELDAVSPNFLSKEARLESENEQRKLRALPLRSDYLAPVLLEWARQNPADPEVPKALHFFVASTRMECGGAAPKDAAGKPKKHYSKEAFELLHGRYPKNEWAIKTKYYY